MSQLTKANREIKRLKRCLKSIKDIALDAALERLDAGRNNDEDPCTRVCKKIWRRANRTLLS
jgi:hypothetical protein